MQDRAAQYYFQQQQKLNEMIMFLGYNSAEREKNYGKDAPPPPRRAGWRAVGIDYKILLEICTKSLFYFKL